MKAKLGSLKKIEALKYDGIKSPLKKSIVATLSNPETNGMTSFVLLSGDALKWQCGASAEKSLLFLDDSTQSLIKDIKASKDIDLKQYAYGQCKVARVGNDVVVYLCPEKGKLTQAALLKPIKKAFKTFKPKIFMEVVADFTTIEETSGTGEGINTEEDEEQPAADPKPIGEGLVKYHKHAQKLKKQLKGMDKNDPARQKLLIDQTKTRKHLKRLTNSWTTDVLPALAGSSASPTSATTPEIDKNWQKVYDHWFTFFEKRQAAKTGDTSDADARLAEEERIYAKTLQDVERFMDNMEKGYSIDPSVIESDIESLRTHFNKWRTFAGDKSAKADDLKDMAALIADLDKQWAKEKPRLVEYAATSEAFEKAIIDNKPQKEIEKLYNKLDQLANA